MVVFVIAMGGHVLIRCIFGWFRNSLAEKHGP